jgi:RimJ/RimL family protein N-acetyltransferase
MERLELLTELDNAPMVAAAKSAGLAHEGVLRSYVNERGHRLDLNILSLLRADLNGDPT